MQSDLTKFYEKQISLTEWFEAIGHPDASKLRLEDNNKHERLDTLNQLMGLPYGKPTRFAGKDVASRTPAFTKYLKEHGDEPCAIRLIPNKPGVPKLRMRGHVVADAVKWFDAQKINPEDYEADFVPHDNSRWATIFVVTDSGIFGEVKYGKPNELTQGLYSDDAPIAFQYDFKNWQFSEASQKAEEHVKDVISKLHTADKSVQQKIAEALDAAFTHDYLKGYFETSTSDEYGVWFLDYNRLLGDITPAKAQKAPASGALVSGRTGSPGEAEGVVRIVEPEDLESTTLKETDILVCRMTTPDYLPLMKQAAGIVTDLGGILSHAAIVARELKKPCITGTKDATSKLQTGQKVILDADSGVVRAA